MSTSPPDSTPLAAADSAPARTLRLVVAYDGSEYCGWQVQPDQPSIQGEFQRAIREFTGETPQIAAAGRTDSGVHAIGQVISFVTQSRVPAPNFRPGLQRFLPDDIVIRDVVAVAPGFHAQFAAVRKRYRYLIFNGPARLPFLRRYAGWHRAPLDWQAMHAAAQVLVGTHDFRSFETEFPNKLSSVRTVFAADWSFTMDWNAWRLAPLFPVPASDSLAPRLPDVAAAAAHAAITEPAGQSAETVLWPGQVLQFDIVADGFLYNMVRAIVGTLIHVGRGRWTADDVRRILESGDRRLAGETAPAEGLYLLQVDYPADESAPVSESSGDLYST